MKASAGLLTVFLLFGLLACRRADFADLLLKNGFVLTMDPENPRAQAVAIKGNIIISVGSDRELEQYVKPGTTKIIDLRGRMVVPGFIDAHVHFVGLGEALEKIDLGGITSYDQMKEKVAARVKMAEAGEWIVGRGWDQTLVPDNEWPTRHILDEVAPENPVLLTRIDGHSILVNSYVLKLFGITSRTPDPPGGTIVRDPSTGEPTGILKENATALVKLPTPSREEKTRQTMRQLRLALEQAKKYGVTSIHHLSGDEEYFELLQEKGELTVRVYLCQRLTDDEKILNKYKELRQRYRGNPLIKFGALKGFMDGTLGSQTAALYEPYNDNPNTSGLLSMPAERLEKLVLTADKLGFQVAIHAIGTRANTLVLDAFEKAIQVNGPRDSRHRIEHAQILLEKDLPRFAQLGVIASMQPVHCITDKRFAEERLGHLRCRYAYAWRSILKAGGRIAFGTDSPVEPLNPMEGLYAAVTRKDRGGEPGEGWFPQERLTMEQAIKLYTLGSAYASFEEDIKGSIGPGKLADLVVLSKNLLEIPEDEIMDTRVVYTIFDGRVIYENVD